MIMEIWPLRGLSRNLLVLVGVPPGVAEAGREDGGMAKGFRPVDRDQPFLLPPDMREWLPEGHLAWFVIDAVAALDLSWFAARATPRGSLAGRAAYDPRMLLALLVYGYAAGVRSSRRIERACWEDVAFRVICAGDVPDHATVARFRREHFADPEAVGGLFGQVLVLAARAGLGRLGLIAVDGTKIAAAASKDANRTERRLRELAAQILAEAEAVDAAEDELYGEARGDELPQELADPKTRAERIRTALAELEAERQAAGAERDAQARAYLEAVGSGKPPRGQAPAAVAVTAARRRLARAEAAQRAKVAAWQAQRAAEDAAGIKRGPGGRKPFGPEAHAGVAKARAALERAEGKAADTERKAAAAKGPGPVRNLTDPDSRLMPIRGGGFLQGYNAQATHSADGLCLGTSVTASTTDYASFEPMMRQAEAAAAVLRTHAPGPLHRRRARIGRMLGDAGYCSEHNLTCPGPDRLIATGKGRDLGKAARDPGSDDPGWGGPAIQAMRERLKTDEGIAAYRHRGHIAETPHGHIKHNMGLRQLSMRGKAKAAAEWTFAAAAHNLFKALTTGHLTSQALDALAATAT
jgi:transposase